MPFKPQGETPEEAAARRAKAGARTGTHTGHLFIKDVPRELKSQFKTLCARRGVPMRLAMISLLKHYMETPSVVKILPASAVPTTKYSGRRRVDEDLPEDTK